MYIIKVVAILYLQCLPLIFVDLRFKGHHIMKSKFIYTKSFAIQFAIEKI